MRQTDIDNWFSYHPVQPGQPEIYAALRLRARALADLFNASIPDCADKTAAMRELRIAVAAMIMAIACYVPPEQNV